MPAQTTKRAETKGHAKLKKWLKDKDLSPSAGAAKIGVSRQTFHKWIHGGRLEHTSALLVQAKTGIPATDFTRD